MTNPEVNPETAGIDEKIAAIMAMTGKDEQTVRDILFAMEEDAGEDVGTIRYNDETNELAHRVMDRGIRKWRISSVEGGIRYDMAKTLEGWRQLNA
jgi:hypothetical protein